MATTAAAATASAARLRRDRRCRFAAALCQRWHQIQCSAIGWRIPGVLGQRDRFVRAQRVEDAWQTGQLRQGAGALRIYGEIGLVGMPILPAESAQDVGGIPFGDVVGQRTTPLSCKAIRSARSA
jgi:hypothetical protein